MSTELNINNLMDLVSWSGYLKGFRSRNRKLPQSHVNHLNELVFYFGRANIYQFNTRKRNFHGKCFVIFAIITVFLCWLKISKLNISITYCNVEVSYVLSFSIFLCVEQWNEFAVDSEEDSTEELYKQMSFEQYGVYYTPYA